MRTIFLSFPRACSFNAEDARCAMPLDDVNPESWRRLLAATSEYCTTPGVSARFDELTPLLLSAAAAGIGGGSGVGDSGIGSSGGGSSACSSGGGSEGALRGDVARGVMLIEAPPTALSEAAHFVDASAAAVASLPQLRRRLNLSMTPAAAAAQKIAALPEELACRGGIQLASCSDTAGGGGSAGYGIVHLALHTAPDCSMVGGWCSSARTVLEPSSEAAQLTAAIHSASIGYSSSSQPAGEAGGLAAALRDRSCVSLPGGELLAVLGHQSVHTRAGALVTSWLFEKTAPDPAGLLRVGDLLRLAPALSQAVLVAAAVLPPELIAGALRAGARAVISPVHSCAASPGIAQAFFSALYATMNAGLTVPAAVAAAERECPALAGVYKVHHL